MRCIDRHAAWGAGNLLDWRVRYHGCMADQGWELVEPAGGKWGPIGQPPLNLKRTADVCREKVGRLAEQGDDPSAILDWRMRFDSCMEDHGWRHLTSQ